MVAEADDIATLHWDVLPTDTSKGWRKGSGVRLAIWPEPANGDYCLQEAGFSGFADPTGEYDVRLLEIARAIEAVLKSHGAPVALRRPYGSHEFGLSRVRRWFREIARPRLTEDELLMHAWSDDQDGDWETEYGAPARAAMLVSYGHAIFWIWLESEDLLAEVLQRASSCRPLVQTRLKWSNLSP